MSDSERREIALRLAMERSLREDCLSTINKRVGRYLEVKRCFPSVIPYTHFSPVSGECVLLYRDGYFFACIALCQAVAEAIVRFLCERNGLPTSSFCNDVGKLYKKRIVSSNCRAALGTVWEDRNDYHHLNPEVETDTKRLHDLAKEKIVSLGKVEEEVFKVDIVKGKIRPRKPNHWK